MARDRNTFAKRQRETEKRRKQDEKREKRNYRKLNPTSADNEQDEIMKLDQSEEKVLLIFRRYLMTPGQMLCLSGNDTHTLQDSLDRMTSNGLLISETREGGYSLTESGFEMMNALEATE